MESIRIVGLRPHPCMQRAIERDRQRDADRRIEAELCRVRTQRRAAPEPNDSYDAYEEAKELLDQYGSIENAMPEVMRRYGGRHNGYPTVDARGQQLPAIRHSGQAGRVLSVR